MATTLFPLQYLRQNAQPIDVDSVFNTTAERLAYLSNGRRYPGQVVADLQENKVYVLDSAGSAWIEIGSGGSGGSGYSGVSGYSGTTGSSGYSGMPGAGTPAGSDTEVQFNDGGVFGANSGFTYDGTTCTVGLSKIISTVDVNLKVDNGDPFMWYAVTGNISATNETGSAVAYDTAGNIYVAAHGAQESAALLIKYTDQGEIVWQKSLYDSTSIESLAGDGVVVDGSGNIVILCQTYNSKFVVAKFDPAGTILWQIMVDNPSLGGEIATDIAVDGTGNIYVSVQDFNNIYVVKLSPLGVYISNTALTGTGYEAYSIAVDTSNNVYLTISTSASTVIIVKIDLAGSITWQREYSFAGGSVSSALGAIAVDSAGYIYASGGSYTTADSMYLFKLDPAGNLVWQRNVIVDSFGIEASGLAFDSTGNIYVAGTWSSGSNGTDFLIFKYSQTGTLLWQRSFGSVNDDDQWWNYGSQILSVNGDTYALNGYSWFSSGNRNILTAQFNTDGSGTGTYGNFTYEATSFIEDAVVFSSTAGGVVPGSTVFNATPTTFTVDNSTYTNNTTVMVGPPNWYFNADGSTQLPGYTLPVADGTCGQALVTDGAGNVGWASSSVGPATPTTLGTVYGYTTCGLFGGNTSLGYCSGNTTQIGTDNITLGFEALLGNIYGNSNIAMGRNTLRCNTSGEANIAIGYNSLSFNTTGSDNIAIGRAVLTGSCNGSCNIAIGTQSLSNNNTGNNNVAIGRSTLGLNSLGNNNVAIGNYGLYWNCNGNDNIAFGNQASYFNRGSCNIAMGSYAGYCSCCGCCNISIGSCSQYNIRSGTDNIAIGVNSLVNADVFGTTCSVIAIGTCAVGYGCCNGCNIVAIGNCAGKRCVGTCSVAVGHGALCGGGYAGATAVGNNALKGGDNGLFNTAIGNASMYSGAVCNSNVALGVVSMYGCVRGFGNTAIGAYSMYCGVSGGYNVAVGINAMYGGPRCSAFGNVGVGTDALFCLTSGSYNVAVGGYSLDANTSGCGNTAVGYNSLTSNINGTNHTALGLCAMRSNTTGEESVAIGFKSHTAGSGSLWNVAIGSCSLYCTTCGNTNVAIGYAAAYLNTTGGANIAVGLNALCCNTTGSNNIAIGNCALLNNVYSRNNIAIGFRSMACGFTVTYGNVGVGNCSLACNTGCRNVAVGSYGLCANTTGYGNTALGYQAGLCNITGQLNVAVGFSAGLGIRCGNCNISIGTFAGGGNGTDNVALGYLAVSSGNCGAANIGVGAYSLTGVTSGACNIAVGKCALVCNTTGCLNIAVGYNAGCLITTGVNNTIIGTLPAANGCVCTLLIGAGTCERIKVDNNGLCVNGATLQGNGLVVDAVGFRTLPQNSQSANYTTVAADSGKHLLHPSSDANPRTYTIDSNLNVPYPVGTAITFVNKTSQVLTIAINSDTLTLAGTTTTGSRTLGQNGVATAVKIDTTEWIISGTGLT